MLQDSLPAESKSICISRGRFIYTYPQGKYAFCAHGHDTISHNRISALTHTTFARGKRIGMSTTQNTTNNVSPVNVEVADELSAPPTLTRLTTKADQNDDVAGAAHRKFGNDVYFFQVYRC